MSVRERGEELDMQCPFNARASVCVCGFITHSLPITESEYVMRYIVCAFPRTCDNLTYVMLYECERSGACVHVCARARVREHIPTGTCFL